MLERFEKFTNCIYELQRCWNRIAADEMEFYGLKGSHAIYLVSIYRRPEGVTAKQLGALCGRDKADISRAVAVLETKGMLKKQADDNRYRARLVLTEYGRAVTESIVKKALIAEQIAGNGLSEEDRSCLYRTLSTVCRNMRDLCESGIPQTNEARVEEGGSSIAALPNTITT